ncbi:DsbA family oxidoreductase [Rhodobacteraceae bacterium RKSG542]|uniref:DsbA family oxidoreductase n=1 Tax=Pseudovibrio flavus TaxID=2529854 RepID=UPI0012BBC70D|nr:DsbA family oxidoreductase [Pseudovibrio flavus]MTI16249.1 DsbA family oxidoreductase [Pseudovibrio flavus]
MTQNTAPLKIDIVSDVVCPWCIIGYKQLEQALKETGTIAEVEWHPFELNPTMPPEGQNLREHLAEKYGTTPEGSREARARLSQLGGEVGFTFAYDDDMRMVNTFKAHQLLTWAKEFGKQHELKMALFKAYFTDQKDVSDIEVLQQVAEDVGLDSAATTMMLRDGRYAPIVRNEEQQWTSRGIHGVPAMIFNLKHLVSGAQGVENYKAILQQLAQIEPAS